MLWVTFITGLPIRLDVAVTCALRRIRTIARTIGGGNEQGMFRAAGG